MDRRYYELKAVVLGLSLAAAIVTGGYECSRFTIANNPDYRAAVVAESAIRTAGVQFTRSVGQFFAHALATTAP